MKWRHLCVSVMLFVGSLAAVAQIDIDAIKNDTRFYHAEGYGLTDREAHDDALSTLSRQVSTAIVDRVKSTSNAAISGSNITAAEYMNERVLKSYSEATLSNVTAIFTKHQPDAVVFVYMEKAEIDRMLERRKQLVIDYAKTARKAEERLQIDDALRYYYWSMMAAKSVPEPVYVDIDNHTVNCAMLDQHIKAILGKLKANLSGCQNEGNRVFAQLRITYDGHPVSSVELSYFNGSRYDGPVLVKDGVCELELTCLPADKKLRLEYEYAYKSDEGTEISQVINNVQQEKINVASVDVPVKVDDRYGVMKPEKKSGDGFAPEVPVSSLAMAPVEVSKPQTIELPMMTDVSPYIDAMNKIEAAIKSENPKSVFNYFTPEGYELFENLVTKTGTVSVVGGDKSYTFTEIPGNMVIGKGCKIKVKYRQGKTFMENLVFRFDGTSHKVRSLALALTQKAEDDIFNASLNWPMVSRYTILQFMEDYQTAFFLKRDKYIESIFDDDAIIITGTVIKKATKAQLGDRVIDDGLDIDLGNGRTLYRKQNKKAYLNSVKKHFKEREYIHLTFEDNITRVINSPRIPAGTAFAIEINQSYDSSVYSDKGYLTLLLDASKELPIIHVRLWQPDKSDLNIDQFINHFPM